MDNLIWAVNRGSATLKLGFYEPETLHCVERRNLDASAPWPSGKPLAVGHRVVHGGRNFTESVLITDTVLDKLRALSTLAPSHQPHNISGIEHFLDQGCPQVACFDTAFHRTQPEEEQHYALPRRFYEQGIQKYGFHGLSYEYVASRLGNQSGRVVVLHLGSGASGCALLNGKSMASTMGFTALDGLVMATRCGRVDPGLIIHLQKSFNMDSREIEHLLYKKSGLLGLSGESNSMQALLQSRSDTAKLAIEVFCYRAAGAVGELAVAIGGLDKVVFTGGIGENSQTIRTKISEKLDFFNCDFDVIETDEEAVIAAATLRIATKFDRISI